MRIKTVAGDGLPGFQDAVDPLQAKFFGLEGIDVSADGKYLYIADGIKGSEKPEDQIYLGLPTSLPSLAPARSPPQMQLFDGYESVIDIDD